MKLTRSHEVKVIADVLPSDRGNISMTSHDFGTTLNSTTFSEKTQLREIDNVLVAMDGLSDTALTMKQMFFDLKMKNEAEKVECMRKVARFRDKLKRLADDVEHHIAEELDQLHQAENLQIQSKIEECESMFNAVEMSKDLTQVMETERFSPQIVHKVNAARQRCVEHKFALQKIHSQMNPVRYNLAIDRTVSEALTSLPGLIGKVEVSHKNGDEFDNFSNIAATTSGIQRDRTNSRSIGGTRIKRMNSTHAQKRYQIYPQQKDDQNEALVTSICVLNNNHFVALDRTNNRLLLIHQDGVIVSQFPFTSQLWGMTIVDSMTVAVTVPDNDKIVLVRVRHTNICAERLIKTTSICFGICAIDGFLVVTVKGGYVKIVTKAGEEVASIRHNHRGDLLFTDPQYVATNCQQNELYVSDYTLHTVTGLFLSGINIDARPKFIFRNNELKNPTGLCLDSAGNVYVCGYSTHNVLKLSGEGQLMLVLLTGVINPWTLAFSFNEDQLYVSVMSNNPGRSNQMQNVIEVYRV